MIGKKIIIVGQGGSGKDYLKSKFVSKGFSPAISHTSREPREGEVEGVDYFFRTKRQFEELLDAADLHEYDIFNGQYYGTTNKSFLNNDVFIKTPRGVAKLTKEQRAYCFIIFIDIDEHIRRERLSNRMDLNDVVERRLDADREDFKDFTDFDLHITNHKF